MTMGLGWLIWILLLAAVSVVWLLRHAHLNRYQREEVPLRSGLYDGPPTNAPRLSVLVAAKDEEQNIEACVRSMLDQDYPDYQLIAINDRSDDRTGEILDAVAAENPRLTAVHVQELREGWFGKNNAMHTGFERADGEWLCFIDADCRQTSRQTLSMAMRFAMEKDVDFLSVLPQLETQSVWEQIIQPACGAVMVFWFNPSNVNDPNHSAAYANGAFMLMKRSAYEAIGGHEPFKTEVNEDMHMAKAAKAAGLRLYVVENRDLYVTRMYTNFRDIWRGWSRIFYGCFETFRRLRISLLVMLFSGLLPWYSAAIAWIMTGVHGWGAAGPWRWVALAATAAVVCQQSVLTRYYQVSQTPPILAPTYPVAGTLVCGMLINAMAKLGGRTTTTWRGTTYRGDKLTGQ
ncbi:MAG: glycosyltransferase [Phycisphaerae bacterium]|nr:glycosyltransferase [Phycisphaerae bacterium]